MNARVSGHARPDAPHRRPQPRVPIGPSALEHPATELHATRRGNTLERRRHVEGVVERESSLLGTLRDGVERREMPIGKVSNLRLHRLVEATRSAAPCDPELLPPSRLRWEGEAVVEQSVQRGGPPGVEGISEAGTDAPPGEQPKHALVVGRASARPRILSEDVEEPAVRLYRPLGALAQKPFELPQEILRLPAVRVRARPSEGSLDGIYGALESPGDLGRLVAGR